jgi:hypothetical protein
MFLLGFALLYPAYGPVLKSVLAMILCAPRFWRSSAATKFVGQNKPVGVSGKQVSVGNASLIPAYWACIVYRAIPLNTFGARRGITAEKPIPM